MNVKLTPEFFDFVTQKVQTGLFASPSEVVCAGLLLLKERDARLAQLREAIQIGDDQIERGEYTEYTVDELPQLAEKIKAEGRKRLAEKAAAKSHSATIEPHSAP